MLRFVSVLFLIRSFLARLRPARSVRLTRLKGGGGVLSVAFSHLLTDGQRCIGLLLNLAAATRGEALSHEHTHDRWCLWPEKLAANPAVSQCACPVPHHAAPACDAIEARPCLAFSCVPVASRVFSPSCAVHFSFAHRYVAAVEAELKKSEAEAAAAKLQHKQQPPQQQGGPGRPEKTENQQGASCGGAEAWGLVPVHIPAEDLAAASESLQRLVPQVREVHWFTGPCGVSPHRILPSEAAPASNA